MTPAQDGDAVLLLAGKRPAYDKGFCRPTDYSAMSKTMMGDRENKARVVITVHIEPGGLHLWNIQYG